MSQSKICETCGAAFLKGPTVSQREWDTKVKYCSVPCYRAGRRAAPSKAQYIPCRICHGPTRFHGTVKNHLYGMLHCERTECIEASRRLKNERIGAAHRAIEAAGERVETPGWKGISRVSAEELLLEPWFRSMGWEPQYRFNTGVHTNKLPRQFQLDFAHLETHLYVEIDGSVHRLRTDRDARRDHMMAERGWDGLRIAASAVRQDVDGVKKRILDWLR